jgi:hypothetical protein
MSPAGFERYFEELAEGLSVAGNITAAALDIRRALSGKHDIEIVGSPRQAAD